MFDTSEVIEEATSDGDKSTDDKNDEASKTSETGTSKLPTQGWVDIATDHRRHRNIENSQTLSGKVWRFDVTHEHVLNHLTSKPLLFLYPALIF